MSDPVRRYFLGDDGFMHDLPANATPGGYTAYVDHLRVVEEKNTAINELLEVLDRVFMHKPRHDGKWDHHLICNTTSTHETGKHGVTCNCRIVGRDHFTDLSRDHAALTAKLEAALEVLHTIAKPALGGKQQQWAAQQFLDTLDQKEDG